MRACVSFVRSSVRAHVVCAFVCVRAFVRVRVRACACVRVCVCACVCGWLPPKRRMILLSSGVGGYSSPR